MPIPLIFLFLSNLLGASLASSAGTFPTELMQYRHLKVARRHVDLLQRSNEIRTTRSITLTYAEENGYQADDTVFASRVNLKTDHETVLLEDIDHLLGLVECSESTMTLEFRESASFEKAKITCESLEDGLIVTSHSTCSEVGAHSAFRVLGFKSEDDRDRIILSVETTTWQKSFKSMKIEFGHSPDPHMIQRHDRLLRRQTKPSQVQSLAASIIPSATPTAESVTFDLAFEAKDTTFQWPEGVSIGPSLPITVGCDKCTTTGKLILTQGEFDIANLSELTEQAINANEEMDFIKSGFFQLELNGFEASIGLKASPSASLEFAYDLFQLPVLGFKIPGFGAAGVLYTPQLIFEVTVSGGIELFFGFDVKVPDHSTIRLDLGQFNKSGITGFDKTTVTALPFNTNASDIQLSMQAGLRQFIPLGVSFLGGDIKLLGGPYVDLPFINTTITQLATDQFDADCKSGQGKTDTKFKNAFKNLTHIESNMGLGVGFEFEAELKLLPDHAYDFQLWSTAAPLATQCLAFQTGGKSTGLTVATAALASITKNAASRLYTPSSELPGFLNLYSQFAILGLCTFTAVFAVL
ncbi:uncharacterized protein BDR25DRAFT_310580 [Lindgomyces ingoldianus]|uniref:Uncharacterized protein n=1 Tax=Lindgomyces ingoldianus TaxID=673940 RepID=A0ACB6R9Y3_9PLEO|nr:uncharacterized protein BDR25DRAFT_310580 [Lindgomyces ingoldianus]KAF2475132.1 hypothetical protein BDR25DRAFT_310580 [Lindgomyces ingoldianus]